MQYKIFTIHGQFIILQPVCNYTLIKADSTRHFWIVDFLSSMHNYFPLIFLSGQILHSSGFISKTCRSQSMNRLRNMKILETYLVRSLTIREPFKIYKTYNDTTNRHHNTYIKQDKQLTVY